MDFDRGPGDGALRIDQLLEALGNNPRGSNTLLRLELWDMPALFLLLITLLCGEWMYRRWRSLA